MTQGQIESMKAGYMRTWHRPATDEELEGLVRDRVLEEAYIREAVALGMDKDDLIIRRRLRQKMEFVSEGLAATADPSDAQLQAYLNSNAAKFAVEPRFSFRQVYLDPQRHGANLTRDADRLLAALRQHTATKAGLVNVGDPIALDHEIDNASARDVGNLFGQKFVTGLGKVSAGQWQGPVESGYGMHLVLLDRRIEGGTPALDDVRDAVRREWSSAQQREAADRYAQALLRKYQVTVEAPPLAAAGTTSPVAAR